MGVITAPLANAPSLSSSFLPTERHALACEVAGNTFSKVGHGSYILTVRSSSFCRDSVSRIGCSWSHTGSRGVQVRAKGKGFGELLQKRRSSESEVEKPEEAQVCPCGGGEESREYGVCCAGYHSGFYVEPDATTLMKARYSAYARSKVDYVVKTTHPDNPDFGGERELAADVHATCERLRFTKLEILDTENTAEDEAFVSFRVTYSLAKGGRRGDKKYLVEKSRFVKEGQRWLYREQISLSQASEAAWLASTTPNYVNPEQARKSFSKTKPQANLSPRKG